MKKLLLLFTISFQFYFQSSGQRLRWAETMGGKDWEAVVDHVNDASGNLYCVGYFKDSLHFSNSTDKYASSAGFLSSRTFIAKYSSDGDLIWSKHLGGGPNSPRSIGIDSVRNVYIFGSFLGQVDFDPGTGQVKKNQSGVDDWFLLKLNNRGEFRWVQTLDGVITEDMIVDGNRILCCGRWERTTDLDPDTNKILRVTPTDTIRGNPYLMEFDTAGKLSSFRQFEVGGSSYTMAIADSGTYFFSVTGISGDLDPGPGVKSFFGFSSNIVVLDSALKYVRAHRNLNGYYHVLPTGEFYSLRQFNKTFDLDPGPGETWVKTNGNFQGSSISKFSKSGKFIWGRQLGSMRSVTHALTVDADPSGSPIVGGYTYDAVQFTPIDSNQKPPNATFSGYFCKLDSAGDVQWTTFLTGGKDDVAKCRTITTFGEDTIYVSGDYTQDCYYYHQKNRDTLIGYGKPPSEPFHFIDGFVGKIRTCAIDTIRKYIYACDSFLIPNTDSVIFSSSTSLINYYNQNDCDSIVIYNVQINHTKRQRLSTVSCDSVYFGNRWLYESGTYLDTLSTAYCDSIVELDAVINVSSDTLISVSSCDSTRISGRSIKQSSLFTDSLKSVFNCDSLVTYEVSIWSSFDTSYIYNDCDSLLFRSQWYTSTQIIVDSLKTTEGCDSTIRHSLRVHPRQKRAKYDTACSAYRLPNGVTVDTSGIYFLDIKGAGYCDTALTLYLEIISLDTAVRVRSDSLISLDTISQYRWLDCLNSFAEVASQKKQFFVPQKRSEYSVELSSWNCKDTSACYAQGPLSIWHGTTDMISVDPNPTSGRFTVSSSLNIEDLQISVHAMDGRSVPSVITRDDTHCHVNIRAEPGLYYVHLETDDKLFVVKILKSE